MTSHLGPLDREPAGVRPPFDVRVPTPPPLTRRIIGLDVAFEAWRADIRRDRAAALREPLAELVLGVYDEHTLVWLAGWDIPTVGGVVSLLHRARAAAPLGGAR